MLSQLYDHNRTELTERNNGKDVRLSIIKKRMGSVLKAPIIVVLAILLSPFGGVVPSLAMKMIWNSQCEW
jgi:hypothetical protein